MATLKIQSFLSTDIGVDKLRDILSQIPERAMALAREFADRVMEFFGDEGMAYSLDEISGMDVGMDGFGESQAPPERGHGPDLADEQGISLERTLDR